MKISMDKANKEILISLMDEFKLSKKSVNFIALLNIDDLYRFYKNEGKKIESIAIKFKDGDQFILQDNSELNNIRMFFDGENQPRGFFTKEDIEKSYENNEIKPMIVKRGN